MTRMQKSRTVFKDHNVQEQKKPITEENLPTP
jgi:hypothetical protein